MLEDRLDGSAAPEAPGAEKEFLTAPSAGILNTTLNRAAVSWGVQTSELLWSEVVSWRVAATDTVKHLGLGYHCLELVSNAGSSWQGLIYLSAPG